MSDIDQLAQDLEAATNRAAKLSDKIEQLESENTRLRETISEIERAGRNKDDYIRELQGKLSKHI